MHGYFSALHQALESQYQPCNCPSCREYNTVVHLADDSKKPFFKTLLNIAEKTFKKLFSRGSYQPEDLLQVEEYKQLVEATAELFSNTIPHQVPQEMKAYLEKDAFVFSGLKTHAQLAEARSFLKDEKGNITPYHLFEQKVLKLNEKYNRHYLEAEYQFAVHSSQSAANWANLQEDTERYSLEYRTAGDERVRDSHAILNGICLPKTNAFWTEYYPPNGWRCRCIAVEVLAREKNLSDSKKAIEAGQKATTHIGMNGKNKLAMFRFNPGTEQKIFPPKNSYAPKHCNGEKLNLTGLIGHAKIVLSLENERCKVNKLIENEAEKKLNKGLRKAKDAELNEWRKKHIPENTGITLQGKQFKDGKIIINRKSAKDVYSHFTEPKLKDLVKDIVAITKKGQFKMESPIDPTSHNYDKKIRAGYESYRYYLAQHKGYNIRINTAVIKGEEFLYSLNLTEF